jgi:hypothetical protein
MVLSDEVVSARAKEMPGSRWHMHMRWLGEEQREQKQKRQSLMVIVSEPATMS